MLRQLLRRIVLLCLRKRMALSAEMRAKLVAAQRNDLRAAGADPEADPEEELRELFLGMIGKLCWKQGWR